MSDTAGQSPAFRPQWSRFVIASFSLFWQMPLFKSTFTTKFIKRFSEINCSSQTMRAFLSHIRAWSVIVCVNCSVWDVLRPSPFFFAYAVRIASMILRTTTFLCVTTQKFALTRPLIRVPSLCSTLQCFTSYADAVHLTACKAPSTRGRFHLDEFSLTSSICLCGRRHMPGFSPLISSLVKS